MDNNEDLTLVHLFFLSDILLAVFAIFSLIGNGFILTLFASQPSLRKNEGIYLLSVLCLADFILALTIIPFITLLIIYRDAYPNYPATQMLLFSLPIVIEIKINLVLTLAIALDRLTAIQWPIDYRLKKKSRYAIISFLVGTLWAAIDVAFLFSTTTIQTTSGCATAGCFMSQTFRFYWWTSNMFISSIAMAITVIILIKLRCMHNTQREVPSEAVKKMVLVLSHIFGLIGFKTVKVAPENFKNTAQSRPNEQERFHHANRVAVNVLLCSGFCILLPNICASVSELVDEPMFQYTGPFVPVGLVLCGFINTFIYALKHKDIRHAIRVFGVRRVSVSRREINVDLIFPPRLHDVGDTIPALGLHVLDADDLEPHTLHRNPVINTWKQLNEWFI